MRRVDLQGGCYVLSGAETLGPGVHPVIGRDSGAKHLSQYLMVQEDNPPPMLSFGKADVLLFILSGAATVLISGKHFSARRESGLYVRPDEAFQIIPEKTRTVALITVCPEDAGCEVADMPANFDNAFPTRVVAPDPKQKEVMGDRFYQVLISKNQGSVNVTQFIGEIPLSKAPSHHHLYEEALYVLSGEGFMWTEGDKAPVAKGSIIFLPQKQEHALECTSPDGLRLAGHFYPAGSPAENY